MNIDNLKIFVEVAKVENFTEVANQNNMTNRGVSKIVSNLEDELGLKLFIRDSNKIYLNANGQYFLQKAQTIINNYNHILIEVGQFKLNNNTSLNIGYFSPYEGSLLFEVAKTYKKLHPNINIYTFNLAIEDLIKRVQYGVIDLCLVIDFGKPSNVNYDCKQVKEIDLFTEELVVGVSYLNHLNNLNKVSLNDIIDENIYYYVCDSSTYIEDKYRSIDPMLSNFNKIYNQTSFENMLMNVSLNNGITFLSRRFSKLIAKDELSILTKPLENMPNMKVTLKLLVNKSKLLNPHVNNFINDIIKMCES